MDPTNLPLSADARGLAWTSTEHAARVLGLTVVTLRRALDRHARRGPDGVTEARVNGVRARKWGRQWRVALGEGWALRSPEH